MIQSNKMLRFALALLCSLGVLFQTESASAEEAASPFQDLSFDAALKKAGEENKIVFIDFFTTWCGPCKRLDETTWRDPAVAALLKEKTIALRIDAEKNAELANRYHVEAYPTMALLKPDGTVLDTLVGYRDAKTFTGDFTSSLAGKSSLARAKEASDQAKGADAQAQARFNLGNELARKGSYADALTEYLWCFDDGMKQAQSYSGVRVSFLLSSIADLGKHYPPALEALQSRRDSARKILETNPTDSSALGDFAGINHYLGKDQDTLAFFDKLPPQSPARTAIGYHVFDLLLEAKRYDDAAVAMPYARFMQTFQAIVTQAHSPAMSGLPADAVASMLAYQITSASKEIEALAGAGQADNARALLKTILDLDHSDKTLVQLRDHLTRAGHPELMPK